MASLIEATCRGKSFDRADFDLAKLDDIMSDFDKTCCDKCIEDWESNFTNKEALRLMQQSEELDEDSDCATVQANDEIAGTLVEPVNPIFREGLFVERDGRQPTTCAALLRRSGVVA